jgi:hypothetical protein
MNRFNTKDEVTLVGINQLIDECNAKLNANANAVSASKLASAKTIAISGGATGTATSFDGSGNITIPVTGLDMSKATAGILSIARGGTGSTTKNFVDLTTAQTVAGNKTFSGRVVVSNTTDIAGGTANTGAFIVGSESSNHIGIDPNEIIAKTNGTTSGALNLQTDGGTIICGGTTALTSFTVKSAASTFSGSVTCENMTVKSALSIPGGSIWIS